MEWSLLAALDEAERERLLATTRRRRFAKGEVVVHEGDPADSLHLVESGMLAVRVTTADGASATLNVLGPGSYFGELSLLDGHPPTRSATVVALEPAETRVLSASGFAELRRDHRAAEQLLLTLLARRVEELSADCSRRRTTASTDGSTAGSTSSRSCTPSGRDRSSCR